MRMYRCCALILVLTGLTVYVQNCRADQVVCKTDGFGNDACDVILPNVLAHSTDYPAVQFMPGDIVTVTASGCVQTGGHGETWKQYVSPSGDNTDRLYHGLITIPGATQPLVRISSVMNQRLPPSTGGILTLGYEDDDFTDNGYWSHDNGTGGQCVDTSGPNMGRAIVHLAIQRANPPLGPGSIYGMCQKTDILHETCRVDRPDVTQAMENYPSIVFLPGDGVTISADGCVQTGGIGNTWKDYVHPSGPNSVPLYQGLILIPGVTSKLTSIADVLTMQQQTGLPPSTGGTLTLGYNDDSFGDNGYYSHDDGTEAQCRGKGPASVTLNITHPTPIAATAISAGFETTCETNSAHRLFCFGVVVGDGTSGAHLSPTMPKIGMVIKFALSNDLPFGCALAGNPDVTGSGPVWCWTGSGIPAPVHGLANAVDISVGGPGACAVLATDRSVRCWSLRFPRESNDFVSTFFTSTPNSIPGLPNGIAQVSVGQHFACAVSAVDGKVYCWGRNDAGQLGRGVVGASTSTESDASIPVVNLTARQVAAGTDHACAVATDNSIQCWGDSTSGQLGDGTNSSASVPTPQRVSGINNAREVAASAQFSCAALADSTARCWGQNLPTNPRASTLGAGLLVSFVGGHVQLEKPLNAFSPLPVKNLTGVSVVSTGTTHACALGVNGKVSCWGSNDDGQLTDYTTNPTLAPVTP